MSRTTRHLGILGGGQLGRMLGLAARPLGIEVTVVEPTADAPAAAVAQHIKSAFDDVDGLKRLAQADVVTFEFENVPDAAARVLEDAVPVFPSPEALRIAQDRLVEKTTLEELGIATPRWRQVDSLEDAQAAFDELGPMILKTRRFGYDGKGQALVREADTLKEAFASLQGAPAVAEELVRFDREISVIVCRAADDSSVVYPITQNTHSGGILVESVAPAPDLPATVEEEARIAARKLVDHFGYVGVLALELFLVGDTILANEFAPRVHNSGHWTIEGACTSQFENHVRAVCGLPLGSVEPVGYSVMLNLIGALPDATEVLAVEDAHFHDYGKEPRAGRKVGHITLRGKTAEEAMARAKRLQPLVKNVT